MLYRRSAKQLGRQLLYLIRTPKAMRMMVLGVALVIYVKLRSFLAVDQLVRIYREVSKAFFDSQTPWRSESLLLSSSSGAFPMDFEQAFMSADGNYQMMLISSKNRTN